MEEGAGRHPLPKVQAREVPVCTLQCTKKKRHVPSIRVPVQLEYEDIPRQRLCATQCSTSRRSHYRAAVGRSGRAYLIREKINSRQKLSIRVCELPQFRPHNRQSIGDESGT